MTTDSARALLRRLGQLMDGFSVCFSRRPQREAARRYLDGLFNDSERKSMEAMHGRLSDPGTYQALQHFITHSPWDATRVWTHLRTLVPTRTGILALDDTGFPKQGTASVGVQRQYCGALGKIGNCQVAVSSALIADGRTWPLTFELYVPESWITDAPRRRSAGIPETLQFRQKWRIALAHVRTVLKAGFTVTGVVVDADYGSNAAFRGGLERLGLRYAVAIRGVVTFWTAGARRTATAAGISAAAHPDAWHTVTWGAGTTGALTASFYAVRVRASKGRGDRRSTTSAVSMRYPVAYSATESNRRGRPIALWRTTGHGRHHIGPESPIPNARRRTEFPIITAVAIRPVSCHADGDYNYNSCVVTLMTPAVYGAHAMTVCRRKIV